MKHSRGLYLVTVIRAGELFPYSFEMWSEEWRLKYNVNSICIRNSYELIEVKKFNFDTGLYKAVSL